MSVGVPGGQSLLATPGPGLARAVAAYGGMRAPRERLLRLGLAGGLGLGLARLRRFGLTGHFSIQADGASSEPIGPQLVHCIMAAAAGLPAGRCLIVVRAMSDHYKPTIVLLDAAGEPTGFAKLGWTPATARLVEHERKALDAVGGPLGPDLYAPRLLGSGEHLGRPFQVSQPLPRRAHRHGRDLPSAAVMRQLSGRTVTVEPFRLPLFNTDFDAHLGPRRASLIEDARTALAAAWRNGVTAGRSHGDWVPWNTAAVGNRLVAWDWEHFEPIAPAGTDAFHWDFLSAHHLEKRGWEESLRRSLAALPSHMPTGSGIPSPAALALHHVASLLLLSARMRSTAGTEPYPLDPIIPSLIRQAAESPA